MSNRKVVMVTGSSKGIGRQIALTMAESGYGVILHGRTESSSLQETKALIETAGSTASFVTGDFASFEDSDFDRFAQQVIQLAGADLEAWVNNAGVDVLTGATRKISFAEKLELLFRVDVRSTILLTRLLSQHWSQVEKSDKLPSIVNIGWDQAESGLPGDSGQMFASSKGAIMAMTSSLAQSFAPHVRINCVAPGWIKTQWGEASVEQWDELIRQQSCMGRWGSTDDVAEAVRFLLSPLASFVNGQVLKVNGGLNIANAAMAMKLK